MAPHPGFMDLSLEREPSKEGSRTRNQAYFGARKSDFLEREKSPNTSPQGAAARNTEVRILTMLRHGSSRPGKTWRVRIGAIELGNQFGRLDDDTVNADRSDGSARRRIRDSRVCPRVMNRVAEIGIDVVASRSSSAHLRPPQEAW